jgi:hypothetical protein
MTIKPAQHVPFQQHIGIQQEGSEMKFLSQSLDFARK